MGVVYLATDPLLRRTVAIKVLPGQDDELHERFAREARSAASLRHHNIVTIFDIGEDEGQPFIAMEFLDGESMAELIRRRAPLSVEKRLQLMIELCAGLGYAHRSGIIHRDIKPGNLMITTEGSLKVLDFGLVRLSTEETNTGLTRAGAIMGTPHYMSPEQVHGKPVDPRSDIFSVGLVLYEVLAYRQAYPGDSAHVVLHNIVHTAPPPIRDFVPDIDPELERIVEKGIEKEPDRRYQNLAALAAELERVRAHYTEAASTATLIKARPERSTPVRHARTRANLDATEQRSAQVEASLTAAAEHLAAGQYEDALAECENAVLLKPQDELAEDLMAQAHAALDERQVREWLDEARARLASGALTEAQALIDQTLMLRQNSAEALSLRKEVRERRSARERTADGARAARAALDRATRSLDDGAFEAAARSASEVLAHDPRNEAARDVKRHAAKAIEARGRQQGDDRRAAEVVEQARLRAAGGDPHGALTLLEAFTPAHPLVTEALDHLSAQIDGGAATLVVDRPKSAKSRGVRSAAGAATSHPPKNNSRRGLFMTWAGPGAALVLLMAGGSWYFTRERGHVAPSTATPPVDAPSPNTTTTNPAGFSQAPAVDPTGIGDASKPVVTGEDPASSASAQADINRIHTAFMDAMRRNRVEQATTVLLEAPHAVRAHATLAADADLLVATAKRRVSDAWSKAQKEPATRRSADFLSAQEKQNEATKLERLGQLPEAARGFIEAADLYARATPSRTTEQAQPPLTTKASPPMSPPVSPPVTAPLSPSVSLPATPPVTPPVSPKVSLPVPPPAVSTDPPVNKLPPTQPQTQPPQRSSVAVDATAQDTTAIEAALAQYVAGYEHLDVGAIKRIYPNVPANLDLSKVRSYSLVLEKTKIDLDGDKATVTATRRLRVQMKSGSQPDPQTVPTEFTMRRTAGGWVVERVR